MARRTLNIPTSVEALVEQHQRAGESFSAAAARLMTEGAEALGGKKPPRYVSSGEGPKDMGRNAEKYLRELVSAR